MTKTTTDQKTAEPQKVLSALESGYERLTTNGWYGNHWHRSERGVRPDETWYRPDPDTKLLHQCLTTCMVFAGNLGPEYAAAVHTQAEVVRALHPDYVPYRTDSDPDVALVRSFNDSHSWAEAESIMVGAIEVAKKAVEERA